MSDALALGILINATALFVIAALVGLVRKHIDASRDGVRRSAIGVGVVLLAWFVFAHSRAGVVGAPGWVFPALIVAPIMIGVMLSYVDPLKSILKSVPVAALVWIQMYRAVGVVFLIVHHRDGSLPAAFAYSAGWGDVATALLAIPTSTVVSRGAKIAFPLLMLWTAVGVGDLIAAPLTANIVSDGPDDVAPLASPPLNIIPVFFRSPAPRATAPADLARVPHTKSNAPAGLSTIRGVTFLNAARRPGDARLKRRLAEASPRPHRGRRG